MPHYSPSGKMLPCAAVHAVKSEISCITRANCGGASWSQGLLWDVIWPELARASCSHSGRTCESDEDHWTESMALLLRRLRVRGHRVANPSAGLAAPHYRRDVSNGPACSVAVQPETSCVHCPLWSMTYCQPSTWRFLMMSLFLQRGSTETFHKAAPVCITSIIFCVFFYSGSQSEVRKTEAATPCLHSVEKQHVGSFTPLPVSIFSVVTCVWQHRASKHSEVE